MATSFWRKRLLRITKRALTMEKGGIQRSLYHLIGKTVMCDAIVANAVTW